MNQILCGKFVVEYERHSILRLGLYIHAPVVWFVLEIESQDNLNSKYHGYDTDRTPTLNYKLKFWFFIFEVAFTFFN